MRRHTSVPFFVSGVYNAGIKIRIIVCAVPNGLTQSFVRRNCYRLINVLYSLCVIILLYHSIIFVSVPL